ncbi:uncharacterized protein LOC115703860 [Cannabis sativa]|uniref:uncharacterized protein LOC115703860 n=1 Tax=Cannabis sativa TaxID=3483 RepID=UPI0029CA84C3|nr:uncharacterized protein LOC115703860 [Cannabis sativa]
MGNNIDHCSCIIKSGISDKIGFKPFRYYNFWSDHPEFKDIVLTNWRKPIKAQGMHATYLKMMRLKHCLRKFNHDLIGDIVKKYQEAKSDFLEARLQAQAHSEPVFLDIEKVATANFLVQEKMYFSFLRQRSKVTWIHKGDENSSFFHACLKKKRLENNITSFTNEHGEIVENYQEVVNHFISHFYGIMGTRNQIFHGLKTDCMSYGHVPDLDEQLGLLKLFSNKDIRDTENPSNARDYRPIVCCSTIYKCISKLLCSRLAGVLPSLINQNQEAFIQGRSIAHNVMILQDLLKNYNKKNGSPRYSLKIDISKAYDNVSWDFLEQLLATFKFPQRFIKWIMVCLRATSYSIVMNGRIQGKFEGEKKLRQEDSISPLLFVLIMEYLTRSLFLAANNSPFKYLIQQRYKSFNNGDQTYSG